MRLLQRRERGRVLIMVWGFWGNYFVQMVRVVSGGQG